MDLVFVFSAQMVTWQVWRAGDDRPHLVEEGEEGAAEHDPAPS